MQVIHYIGLDVHKKTIAFCEKTQDGRVSAEGIIEANRSALERWANQRGAWVGGMEATLFTGWIYDFLKPFALELKVGHPLMLRSICAGKKKSDKIDARKLADLLRCDLFPESYMAPTAVRDLRRVLRFRNLLVRQAVRMKNKTAGLLMECGVPYEKKRLHGRAYFAELLERIEDVPESLPTLLNMSRSAMETFDLTQKRLIAALRENKNLASRIELLMSIPGVGEVTALTWALEAGPIERFASIRNAISYCGLCSAQRESAGKIQRGPLSKQRNKFLQSALIEAAKLAPQWNSQLAEVRKRELETGNHNQATIAVARKLVAYLVAVDRDKKPFQFTNEKANQKEEVNALGSPSLSSAHCP
jgi:transposase